MAETLHIVATSATSADSLARLQRVLEGARARKATAEELVSSIGANAPEYAPLAQLIGRLRGVPIIAWISLALAIVAVVQADAGEKHLQAIEGQVDRVYQAIQAQAPSATPSQAASAPATKVGRNEPCPCGSGKKYKRCHGGPRPIDSPPRRSS